MRKSHRRYPDAGQMMGIGNITELTSADTTGVNALLLAICQETGVRAVLTTEVIPWARGAVREIDVARRLMYHAVRHRTLPKNVDDRLVTVKDPEILAYDEAELRQLHARRHGPQLPHLHRPTTRSPSSTTRSSSAAPTSRRSSRSSAWTKRPTRSISGASWPGPSWPSRWARRTARRAHSRWGYLTPPDDTQSEHVKLTQRRRRADGPAPREGAVTDAGMPLVDNLGETGDPIEVVARFLDLPGLVFLDSATGPLHAPATRISSADTPFSPRTRPASSGARGTRPRSVAPALGWTPVDSDPLLAVREMLAPFAVAPVSGLPPFQGGAAGYVGYDYGAVLERLPPRALRRSRDSRRDPRPVRLGRSRGTTGSARRG